MSVELATAYVNIQASTKGLGKDITSTMGGAGTDGGQVAAQGFRQKFTGGLKGIGKVAGPLLGLGLGVKAFDWIKQGTLDAQAMNSTLASMQQQIKTTGGAAGKSVGQLSAMADKMEMKIGVDAQEIVEAQSVLLTFTKVSGKEFDKATGLAFDMAAVLGGDAKSASMQLGKALNDPVKGMTSLSRAGVQFTAQQKEQAKAMIASGDVTGAQGIILKELETQFGGTAEKSADSTAKIGLMFDNMKEEVGAAVTGLVDKAMPHLQKFGEQAIPKIGQAVEWVGKTATPIIKNIAETFMRNWPQIKETAMSVMAGVTGAVRTATGVVKVIGKVALPILKGLVGAFNGLPGPAKTAVVAIGGLALAGPKIGRGIQSAKALASSLKATGTAAISAGKSMATGAVSAGKWVVQAGRAAASGAKSAIVGVGNAAKAAGTAALSGAKSLGAWALAAGKSAASAIASTASIVGQKVAMIAGKVATGVATAAQWLWNAALTANPIGLVIAAIVGIVAALVLAYNKVGWFKAFVDTAFRFIGNVVKSVVGFISSNWKTLLAILTGPIGIAVRLITAHWSKIKAGFGAVKSFIVGAISAIGNYFKTRWNAIAAVARAIITGLKAGWSAARNFVTSMVARIVSTVVGIKNRVTGSLGRVFDTLKSGATEAKNWVDGKVSALVNLITGIPRRIGNMASAISEPFKWAFSRIAQFWNNTAGKLSFTAPSWVPGIGGRGFSMPNLPTYHTGGEVLGPKGQEVPIMALAGERVLSLKETAAYDAGRPSGRGGTDPIYQLRGATVELNVNARGFADAIRKAELVRR